MAGKEEVGGGYTWKSSCCQLQGHGLYPGLREVVTGILGTSLTRASSQVLVSKLPYFCAASLGRSGACHFSCHSPGGPRTRLILRTGLAASPRSPNLSGPPPPPFPAPVLLPRHWLRLLPRLLAAQAPSHARLSSRAVLAKQGQSGRCPHAGGDSQPYAVEEPECQP